MDYKIQKVTGIGLIHDQNRQKIFNSYFNQYQVLQLLNLKDKKILIIIKDKDIQILNKNSFKFYSSIKSNDDYSFFSATQLTSTGNIACCKKNGIIAIYIIKPKLSKLIQTIQVLNNKCIYRIKHITENRLMSNQDEKSLIFYEYNKKKLVIKNKIIMENYIENFLPTKNNDVLLYANFFCPSYHFKILLFDSEKLKIIKEVLSCNGNSEIYEPFSYLTKNIIAIVIKETIFLVDINNDYAKIAQIESKGSSWIYSVCCVDCNKIVTGDKNRKLILWNFEKNEISKIGEYNIEKRNDLDYAKVTCLLKLKNNLLLVGGNYYFLNAFNFFRKNNEI
jgi:hypothetical protein